MVSAGAGDISVPDGYHLVVPDCRDRMGKMYARYLQTDIANLVRDVRKCKIVLVIGLE